MAAYQWTEESASIRTLTTKPRLCAGALAHPHPDLFHVVATD